MDPKKGPWRKLRIVSIFLSVNIYWLFPSKILPNKNYPARKTRHIHVVLPLKEKSKNRLQPLGSSASGILSEAEVLIDSSTFIHSGHITYKVSWTQAQQSMGKWPQKFQPEMELGEGMETVAHVPPGSKLRCQEAGFPKCLLYRIVNELTAWKLTTCPFFLLSVHKQNLPKSSTDFLNCKYSAIPQ